MNDKPITKERIENPADFRVQGQPPNKLLYAILYKFMLHMNEKKAQEIRDRYTQSTQDDLLKEVKEFVDSDQRGFEALNWCLSQPSFIEPELWGQALQVLLDNGIDLRLKDDEEFSGLMSQ